MGTDIRTGFPKSLTGGEGQYYVECKIQDLRTCPPMLTSCSYLFPTWLTPHLLQLSYPFSIMVNVDVVSRCLGTRHHGNMFEHPIVSL